MTSIRGTPWRSQPSSKTPFRIAEPYWGRECRFLTALFNDDVSVASSLLEGFDGPQVDPDIRIRIGGDFKPAVCIAVERDHLRLSQFDLDPWFSL